MTKQILTDVAVGASGVCHGVGYCRGRGLVKQDTEL